MKYPLKIQAQVTKAVTKWFSDGLYPPGWDIKNQIKGAHAECAAFIARDGDQGFENWYRAADQKRKEFGNNPRKKDDFDLEGPGGELIDAKWIPESNEVWVTESTHRASKYTVLLGVKFDKDISEFELYRISREDFDSKSSKPRQNKLAISISKMDKVEEL